MRRPSSIATLALCGLSFHTGLARAAAFYDRVGSTGSDEFQRVACSGTTCVAAGRAAGSMSSLLGGAATAAAGGTDCVLASYNVNSGSRNYLLQFGSTSDDQLNGVTLDNSGNAIAVGQYRGSMTIGGTNLALTSSSMDGFVGKFDGTSGAGRQSVGLRVPVT